MLCLTIDRLKLSYTHLTVLIRSRLITEELMALISMGREYKYFHQWIIHFIIDVHAINAAVQQLKCLPLHLRQRYLDVYTDIVVSKTTETQFLTFDIFYPLHDIINQWGVVSLAEYA